ncbi:MAG: hypothetical protein ACR2QF_06355 [Geminicoccaceae bacterium]
MIGCKGILHADHLSCCHNGDRSGAGGNHRFQLSGRLAELPANEIVEQFMEHLHDSQFLANRYAYELNAAIKVSDKDVVIAMGTIVIQATSTSIHDHDF